MYKSEAALIKLQLQLSESSECEDKVAIGMAISKY